MKTAIVTDSNSGIFQEESEQLGIYVLPMPVILDNVTRYEGVDFTSQQFFRAMAEHRQVSTSQPSPRDVLALWNRLLEEYVHTVFSGCFPTAGLSPTAISSKVS